MYIIGIEPALIYKCLIGHDRNRHSENIRSITRCYVPDVVSNMTRKNPTISASFALTGVGVAADVAVFCDGAPVRLVFTR